MTKLAAGDRVELVSVGCAGTVEYANDDYVQVKWDDGKVGLLHSDETMIPKSRHLQKLVSH